MDNYMIIFENLPYSVNGFTIHNGCDDYYTIILNSRMSYVTNLKTFEHELEHINHEDFVKFKNVSQIERRTHTKKGKDYVEANFF